MIECCNEGLKQSQRLQCSGRSDTGWLNGDALPAPFEFSFFFFHSCLLFLSVFPPLVIACLSQIFNFSLLLHFPTFSWICLVCTFPTVHCFHVALHHFLSLQSCWIFLTAICRMSLPSYGLCYLCLTQTKGLSSGLKASQVSPSFLPSPGTFRLTQLIDLLKNYNRVTQETVSRMLRSA